MELRTYDLYSSVNAADVIGITIFTKSCKTTKMFIFM